MARSRWDERFFSTTRGRIVQLVRGAPRTVDELARALDLTDNAIRAHLATLDRDGLVERVGARRGGGKPSFLYGPAADAESLFPKAYSPVLGELLGVLDEHLDADSLDATLREVGHRLAEAYPPAKGSSSRRVAAAAAALEELGAVIALEPRERGTVIRGASCPLADVVSAHPEVCRVVESLLSDLTGLAVREACDRTGPPRCCFEVLDAAA